MRSRSTCDRAQADVLFWLRIVSISDEKPLQMPPRSTWCPLLASNCFNLKEEAAPHATALKLVSSSGFGFFQSQMRSRSTCDRRALHHAPVRGNVSISDEKPLHM